MFDLISFKNELTLIVNNLAQAVATEIFNAAEKVSLNKQIFETEEKLNSLVAEAIDKILKTVTVTPPQCLTTSTKGEVGGECPPSEQTYILVYGSTAVNSKCPLPPLQVDANAKGDANANGENKTDDVTTQHSDPSPTSPPLPAELPDHEYAQPSPPPPRAASTAEGGASAAQHGRKQHCSRRETDTKTSPAAETTETHHQCVQCGMLFPTEERLSDHSNKSHPACSTCGALFTGILRLREHEIKEHGLLPYTCDYCPKRFNHKAHRDLHVKARHTKEKTCHCDICGKGYTCVSVLKTHRMTHFDKMFICDVCGKSFYHACHLTRHKVVHQAVRPHKCSTCGKGFTQAANLRSHQATHGGERELCSVCGKSYRCLKYHLISKHSSELPAGELPDVVATCQVCDKRFPNPSQLKVHQRSHAGEKPFRCDVCGKSYWLKELLRDHKYTHSGEKPYKCSLCPKTFNLATSFSRHRGIHSGRMPYSCLDCGKHFRLLSFLKAHLQTKAHLKQAQQRNAIASDL